MKPVNINCKVNIIAKESQKIIENEGLSYRAAIRKATEEYKKELSANRPK